MNRRFPNTLRPLEAKRRNRDAWRRRRANRTLSVENLEARNLLSVNAILDFDGEFISASHMSQGGWTRQGATSVSSFHSLFDNTRAWLDLNSDGTVNNRDATLAIDQIVARIRQDYAPYGLRVTVGDQDDYQSLLTDSNDGDVMVIVTGGSDIRSGSNSRGVTPWTDLGNEHDEIAWTFGGAIAKGHTSADRFINAMARTISHEMGHAFGLGHILSTPEGMQDARTHHLMNTSGRDFAHDFNFQDIEYETDVFDFAYRESKDHPEFNVRLQNAHRYLSHVDVLGSSASPWLAVLRPGELTVSGNGYANTITVSQPEAAQWSVDIGSLYPVQFGGRTYYYYATSTTTLDSHNPGINSLNPFDAPLSRINLFGQGGDDRITVASDIAARVVAYGGSGNDTIAGGGGSDYLFGDSGDDQIYGGHGTDRLYGGHGMDQLYGQAGNDYLYGGSLFGTGDVLADRMSGGSGRDYFYQRMPSWWTYWQYRGEDYMDDLTSEDRVRFYS